MIEKVLELGYYPVDPSCAGEGAQFINGLWYMPRWGCDTFEHIQDMLEEQPSSEQSGSQIRYACNVCGKNWENRLQAIYCCR